MSELLDVSVVIPCFNASPFLAETLRSVLAQSRLPREILVVDDGSTDDSAAIAASFGEPVRVLRQKNQGESVARNNGIDSSRSTWIAFLDADDLWEPGKLQAQFQAMDAESIGCFTSYRRFGDACSNDMSASVSRAVGQCHTAESMLNGRLQPFISSLVVRRSLPTRFPIWTKYSEDTIYLLDLLRFGQLVPIDDVLTLYRRHHSNQSNEQGIQLRWVDTTLRWIAMQPKEVQDEYLGFVSGRLSVGLQKAFWRRDWKQYAVYEQFLAGNAELQRIGFQYPKKRMPSWAYQLKDAYDRWRKGNG